MDLVWGRDMAGMRGDDTEILDAREVDTWNSGSSFTLKNRVYRTTFAIVWALFARWTPPPWHRWRRAILRLFGASIARTAGVYPSARVWSPANLTMDEQAFVGPRAIIYSMAAIRLGRRALISQGAHICAGTHDIEDPKFQLRSYPIQIGERAWIAAEAFVGPGVTIGEGAVLGARACAFKDLDPWTVYVGNPARPVKRRELRSDADLQMG